MRGVVQIAHGMGEHIGRYVGLIEALVASGLTAYGNDHRGHGRTVTSGTRFGDFGDGGFDLLVFTGGVGENSAVIRSNICERLRWLGIELDGGANHQGFNTISAATCRIAVRVVPTSEEAMIAHHTAGLMKTG